MTDITLRQVEYFLAVLDQGSVSAAAAACSVSQATVSAALGQLERQLGVTLLARGPARRARPTSAGREFGLHARAIVSAVAEAVESTNDDASVIHGTLRFGCIPTAAPRILPGVASTFTTEYPAVAISFFEAPPLMIQRMVLAGEIDIAVMNRKQVQIEGLRQYRMNEVQLHALIAYDHPLAARSSISIAEIIDEPLILLDSPPTADLLMSQIRHLGFEPRVRWLIPNAETIRSMVAMGLGVSLANAVPHPEARSFQGLPVRYLPVTDAVFSNAIVAVTIANTRMSKKLTTALSVLKAVIEDTDPTRWNDRSPNSKGQFPPRRSAAGNDSGTVTAESGQ